MPTPLLWDSPNASFDAAGLTWDGVAQNTNPHPMPDNNRISTADKAGVLAAIATIRTKLPFLITLTDEERQGLSKLGDRTVDFDEKCALGMASHPELIPGYVIVAELLKDRALRTVLLEIFGLLNDLHQQVEDTLTELGHEIYVDDLSFYSAVREAARRGLPGAENLLDELASRFPGRGGAEPESPTPPTP